MHSNAHSVRVAQNCLRANATFTSGSDGKMPKRTDISKIVIIGSGEDGLPLILGQ